MRRLLRINNATVSVSSIFWVSSLNDTRLLLKKTSWLLIDTTFFSTLSQSFIYFTIFIDFWNFWFSLALSWSGITSRRLSSGLFVGRIGNIEAFFSNSFLWPFFRNTFSWILQRTLSRIFLRIIHLANPFFELTQIWSLFLRISWVLRWSHRIF